MATRTATKGVAKAARKAPDGAGPKRLTADDLGKLTPEAIAVYPLPQIATALDVALEKLAAIKEEITRAKNAVNIKFANQDTEERKRKKNPFGRVTHVENGYRAVIDVKKKVDWDQDGLKAALEAIAADERWGAHIAQDIAKVQFSVGEEKFKNLTPDLQGILAPARTVRPQSVDIKVEKVPG